MDDDMTTTRHHHNDAGTVGTPVTGTRADLAAILSHVQTNLLSADQQTLLSALVAYAAP